MAMNDVALCSRALVRIGAAPITSFSDGSAESEIASALYAHTRDALLSSYAWSFASAQAVLVRLAEVPVSDYAYAYALPNDFLRIMSAGSDGRSRGVNYRLSSGVLHTNAENIVLYYLYRPEEEAFPPYFDSALIARLAAEFCLPVTEIMSRADALFRLADVEFSRARQIDAQQDSPGRIEDFTLIDVRG